MLWNEICKKKLQLHCIRSLHNVEIQKCMYVLTTFLQNFREIDLHLWSITLQSDFTKEFELSWSKIQHFSTSLSSNFCQINS